MTKLADPGLMKRLVALQALANVAVLQIARLVGFVPDAWQLQVLQQLQDGARIILCCSRQSGKSYLVAFIAVVVALRRPNDLVLIISGSKDQAKNTFIYIMRFLGQLHVPMPEDTKMSAILANGTRIVILAPNPATVRSYAAPGFVIFDEGAWIPPEVYKAVEPMMATRPQALQAIASTPNGKQGVFFETWFGITAEEKEAGVIRSDWRQARDEWTRIMVPWHECPRITDDWIERERRRHGSRYVAQEYECQFVEAEDSLYRVSDIDAAYGHGVKPMFREEKVIDGAVQPLVGVLE